MKKALSIFLSLVMLLTMSAGLNITARAEQSVKSSFGRGNRNSSPLPEKALSALHLTITETLATKSQKLL